MQHIPGNVVLTLTNVSLHQWRVHCLVFNDSDKIFERSRHIFHSECGKNILHLLCIAHAKNIWLETTGNKTLLGSKIIGYFLNLNITVGVWAWILRCSNPDVFSANVSSLGIDHTSTCIALGKKTGEYV